MGGVIDYKTEITDEEFPKYILKETIRELEEETDAQNINNVKIIGMYYEYPKSSRINFLVYSEVEITKLIDKENTDIIEVSEEGIGEFYRTQKSNLHEVMKTQLEFYITYLNRSKI